MHDDPPVFSRQCGECSMCCKVMEITELEKPVGIWCKHVRKGQGCTIYPGRPPSCVAFGCGYLHWPITGEHWRPSRCKMVIVAEDAHRLAVHVDPSTPNVWKSDPYYSEMKEWARQGATSQLHQIVVLIGRHMIAILPDSDVDLGVVGVDEIVATAQLADGTYTARKLKADDPEISSLEYGREYKFSPGP